MSTFCWPPVPNSGGASGTTDALATTGDPVNVSDAAPPVAGQVLTATGPDTAIWRVPGLRYDAAIRFNLGASGTASIEPGTWGLANELPEGATEGTISIVSSLLAPPVDSRFAVYVARAVTATIYVTIVGAASIQALDGTLHTAIVVPAGAFLEWVLYHDPDLGAIWGLVSDTAGLSKRFAAPWVAEDTTFPIVQPTAPTPGAALTYLEDPITSDATARWLLPTSSQADSMETLIEVDFIVQSNVASLNGNSGTYDGVSVANDATLLLIAQTDPLENGFWQTLDGPWTRIDGYPDPPDIPIGQAAQVLDGETQKGTVWIYFGDDGWRKISGRDVTEVGYGLIQIGSTVELDAHAAQHARGGTDIVAAARISESSGPTTLNINAIADGQLFQRSGTGVVGANTDKIMVYLNTATNTHGTSTFAKVPLDTVSFDTNSLWNAANKRIVPKKAGYYLVTIRLRTNTAGALTPAVSLNGATFTQAVGTDAGTATQAAGGTTLIFCNGTTDYLEAYTFSAVVRAYTVGLFDTYMNVVGPIF